MRALKCSAGHSRSRPPTSRPARRRASATRRRPSRSPSASARSSSSRSPSPDKRVASPHADQQWPPPRAPVRARPAGRSRKIRRPGQCTQRRSGAPPVSSSTLTIQKGMAATSSAVRPLGIVCSAQTTPPLPNPIISRPSRDSAGHSACLGIGGARSIINGQNNCARRDPSKTGHQHWWHRFECDADGQVGRAPTGDRPRSRRHTPVGVEVDGMNPNTLEWRA